MILDSNRLFDKSTTKYLPRVFSEHIYSFNVTYWKITTRINTSIIDKFRKSNYNYLYNLEN